MQYLSQGKCHEVEHHSRGVGELIKENESWMSYVIGLNVKQDIRREMKEILSISVMLI